MKEWTAIALGASLALGGHALAGRIDDGLEAILEEAGSGETISALVYLFDQVDIEALGAQLDAERAGPQARHETVVLALQERASATQGPVLRRLRVMSAEGSVESYKPYWVGNIIRVDGTPAALRELAERPDVATIYFNYHIELIEPTEMKPDMNPRGGRAPEIGVQAVNAPEAWAMGYTGEGVLVANMDTGVDGNHPALANRWAGVADPRYAGHPEWAWFDPYAGQNDFPYDAGGHGTHTMGSVCGGAPGDEVGVAPGAYWIAAAPIDRGGGIEGTVADAITSFQWFVDPDGNPGTNWDVPAVCSNSWGLTTGHGYPPCDQLFWSYLDACEMAGTVILFSAGNEGTSGLRRPSDRATTDYNVCAVAAVDANNPSWPIASFSSRGPTYCTPGGEAAIKPDIAAPGVDVRSSYPGGGYTTMSGTSMASPHVNGVVALVRQACPTLTVDQVKQILYDTAYDLGSPGEDNDYGWGMVDAELAVQLALAMCGPTPPFVYDGYYETPADTPVMIGLNANDPDGEPGPLTFIVVSLPAHGILEDPNGGVIGSVPYEIIGGGNDVLYTPNWHYKGPDAFTFKANDGGVPPDGGDSEIATISITVGVPEPVYEFTFDTNPGWSVEGEWQFGQPTGQGGSSHGYPDPTSGATGNNVYGINLNGDYSLATGGPYYLTTAAIDCSNLTEVELHFQRWLNSDYPPYVYQTVQVSNDGVNWNGLWQNQDYLFIEDNSWSEKVLNISAVADNQATVYIRWGHQVDSSGAYAFSGWNLDDVEIWGIEATNPCPWDCEALPDGQVGIDDLVAVIDHWGPCGDPCPWDCEAQPDGQVGIDDLVALIDHWGPCP